jgi:hypothetical protein
MLPTPTTLHAACHSRLSNVQEAAYCDPGLVSEVSIKNTHFKASIPSPNRHTGCLASWQVVVPLLRRANLAFTSRVVMPMWDLFDGTVNL